MELVGQAAEYLPSCVEALAQGWSADNTRPEAAAEQLAKIEADPKAFLASLVLKEPKGETVTLPDGSKVPRLPSFHRWMWDGEFCGSIGLRWQRGTQELPRRARLGQPQRVRDLLFAESRPLYCFSFAPFGAAGKQPYL